MTYNKWLRDMALLSLEQRRLRDILSICINTWWRVWRRQSGSSQYKQFHFKIFHSKVAKHLNRLPREAVKSPSLDLQNLAEHSTEQPALADLLLSRRVWLNNLQRGFPNSDIVWFCKQFTLVVLFFLGNATLLWTTTLIKKWFYWKHNSIPLLICIKMLLCIYQPNDDKWTFWKSIKFLH